MHEISVSRLSWLAGPGFFLLGRVRWLSSCPLVLLSSHIFVSFSKSGRGQEALLCQVLAYGSIHANLV